MPSLLWATGEKGGVGKSFFARTVLQYYVDRRWPVQAFDLDRSNPDVRRCYSQILDVQVAILSEASKFEDSANAMFNAAIEKDVIANLPAQVGPALRSWIEQNQLLDLADELGVRLQMAWVSDAGFESLKLLKKSLNTYGDRIGHILIANYGMTDDWGFLNNDTELQELLTAHAVPVVALPRFVGNADRNFLDAHSLDFGSGLQHPVLGPISRQRIKTYLRKAYAAFEAAELFTVPVASAPIADAQQKPQRSSRQRVASEEDS